MAPAYDIYNIMILYDTIYDIIWYDKIRYNVIDDYYIWYDMR